MSYAPLATDSTSPPSPNPSETLARATRLLTRPRCLALALVAMLGFAVGSVTLVPNVAPRSLWSGGHLRKASDGALKQQLSGGGGGLSRPPPGEGSFKGQSVSRSTPIHSLSADDQMDVSTTSASVAARPFRPAC